MALNKLFYVYGLDTACFYTDEESGLDKKIIKAKAIKKKAIDKYKNNALSSSKYRRNIKRINYFIKFYKNSLKEKLNQNRSIVRKCREDKLTENNVVSIFDSDLTRSFNMVQNEINPEIIIIKVFYFEVAKNILQNGFYLKNKKYIFFSSSAGQIRTKKMVCVQEEQLNANWNKLTCGLSIDKINAMGGMNKNKFLAYLALCNSATDLWEDFNIDKVIVVNDFETMVNGTVDYIDDVTYNIQRVQMDIPIPHVDGCGMILPSLSNKNFMMRIPWGKGLLGVFDFIKMIKKYNGNPIVKDIWGKDWNVITDDIQIILTKSQIKTWKYYESWEEYKSNFKTYGCSAGKCNIEEDFIKNAKLNYQMLQTLVDITDEELISISQESVDNVKRVTSDKDTMLKLFGATKYNPNKNSFQQSLLLYPELVGDSYTKKTISEIKNSLEKDIWSAKIDINGKYTFLMPDLYAFSEWLFFGIESPEGLLKDQEVFCRLFPNSPKLDCLRSPHLYKEHAVRNNVIDDEKKEWFITDAIYTSCHDLISKLLQFDCDGDKSLVVADETVIAVAERNMKDVVPLYYNMKKASNELITNDVIYEGLILAYTNGNIGIGSNNISKVWNSCPDGKSIGDEEIKIIKLLCMENNFTIDKKNSHFMK